MLALYERGAMQGGLYRGLAPAFALGLLWKMNGEEMMSHRFPAISLLVGTFLFNPLLNLQTMKQVVRGPELQPVSYAQIVRESGVKLVTLGYTAHVARNFVMATAFVPSLAGSDY